MSKFPKRGEIYFVSLEAQDTQGAEIKKSRPYLIIQNDVGNQYAQKEKMQEVNQAIKISLGLPD
jgi:hypothetical protein